MRHAMEERKLFFPPSDTLMARPGRPRVVRTPSEERAYRAQRAEARRLRRLLNPAVRAQETAAKRARREDPYLRRKEAEAQRRRRWRRRREQEAAEDDSAAKRLVAILPRPPPGRQETAAEESSIGADVGPTVGSAHGHTGVVRKLSRCTQANLRKATIHKRTMATHHYRSCGTQTRVFKYIQLRNSLKVQGCRMATSVFPASRAGNTLFFPQNQLSEKS